MDVNDAFVIGVGALRWVDGARSVHLLNRAAQTAQAGAAVDEGGLEEQTERDDHERDLLPTLHRLPAGPFRLPLHSFYSSLAKSTDATCALMWRPMSATSMCSGWIV